MRGRALRNEARATFLESCSENLDRPVMLGNIARGVTTVPTTWGCRASSWKVAVSF